VAIRCNAPVSHVLYAAYGSNLHPARLGQRAPSASLRGTSLIEGFSLCFNKQGQDGSGKCTIAPGGQGVRVAIYTMSDRDHAALDEIEGVGRGYAAATVSVAGMGTCRTYIAEPGYLDDSLRPFAWYRDFVLLGARHHRFDDDYLRRIEAISAMVDPDSTRRAENARLAARLRTWQPHVARNHDD
jgi:gamma-glutamylcyclotransferase